MSRLTLSKKTGSYYFLHNSSERVLELEIFEFNCSLSDMILKCSVDTSLYKPALDKGTYCTYNGNPKRRTECKTLFYSA